MLKKRLFYEITIASMVTLGILSAFLLFNPYRQNLDAGISLDPAVQKLNQDLDSLISTYEQYNYTFGIKICSSETNEVLYSRNESGSFVPASNLKLFPTAIALENLGNNYTWKTDFYTNGSVRNGILQGDLILKAEGDPTISHLFLNKEPNAVFKEWADYLYEKGIKSINGSLIVDNSAFAKSGIGKGWKNNYEQSYYASAPSAFSINENYVRVVVKGGSKSGRAPSIRVFPAMGNIKIVNDASTVKYRRRDTISITRNNETNTIYIRGSITKNRTVGRLINLPNPGEYASNVLYDILENNQINIKGGLRVIETPANAENLRLVYSYESVPLKEVLKKTNKFSNNFLANQIYLTLGYQLKQNSAYSEQVIHDFFNLINTDSEALVIDDGSGLSPINAATPDQFSDILMHMTKSKYFIDFYNSFPIAGVDGTLKNVMRFEPLYKNVRGKTGTINNVKSLCGYIYSKDHELLTFTILVNDIKANRYKIYQFNNEVLTILGNFSRNTGSYQAKAPFDSLKMR